MSADGWARALEPYPTRLLQTEQANIFAESKYEDPAEFGHRTGPADMMDSGLPFLSPDPSASMHPSRIDGTGVLVYKGA